ncbi:hypothetical protein XENOCAPTIV_020200 [Xenoophorus captivus]|uniref:Uncharacterized protein n=1 Tax=Xenoophorus captivus TaxID=1517983 RepID=A0ABV0SJ49_9TELE
MCSVIGFYFLSYHKPSAHWPLCFSVMFKCLSSISATITFVDTCIKSLFFQQLQLLKHVLPVLSCSGLSVLQKVLDTAAEKNWLVTSVNVESMTGASFLKVFQDLDKRKEGQIIIDCETERLTGILKEVK